ncbi:DNA-formamidopyrimidine glycosylase [Lactobacillus sp. PV037]|uniref:DNA-formamidopyrimidine glycosylase n=1 Tax=unclassified Lactobacillus TaxID=2620435 RepID=UPI00223F1485|nr:MULTISPECIES: DNA-formamidopyrimidine glycosylase [unclassified Lactobacillus]QNQ81975.1 DNA-formamidopyrimidine glycosylase [Lactobacillus sp. PV012]QNQ83989.1 DNA-formamidopyrimidine glycosylase [Lactobacillus sp. PV037]
MPEMPEVETVRRTLDPLMRNKTIKQVIVWYPKIVTGDVETFKKTLQGKKIIKVDRYGKYLLIRLSDDMTLVSHLRMEGKYHVTAPDAAKNKHEHVEFLFNDGTAIRYQDVRKFGRMQLVITGTERQTTGIKNLGPEPNTSEFTVDYFAKQLARKKKNIKNALLDQSIVAGLGNIYVDEVLWRSQIHPLSKSSAITQAKVRKLHDNINEIIALAIEKRGTTVHTFLDADGKVGEFQKLLQVYGRAGKKCTRCGTTLKKIKVNGRGTTYCPHCQVEYK